MPPVAITGEGSCMASGTGASPAPGDGRVEDGSGSAFGGVVFEACGSEEQAHAASSAQDLCAVLIRDVLLLRLPIRAVPKRAVPRRNAPQRANSWLKRMDIVLTPRMNCGTS